MRRQAGIEITQQPHAEVERCATRRISIQCDGFRFPRTLPRHHSSIVPVQCQTYRRATTRR